MNISLLCPTRNRSQKLEKLITSINDTISNSLTEVELLFMIDTDDLISIAKIIELQPKAKFEIKKFITSKSEYLNRDYYNVLAKNARGFLLFAIGDDVEFKSKDWDKILLEKISEYFHKNSRIWDNILYISVNEENSTAKHPCFPIITKEAFNVLGMYFHPELLSWGADRTIWEVYSGINRTLHIPEITINHASYHDGKQPIDEVGKSMRERFFRNPNCHNEISATQVPKQIEFLKNYIKNYHRGINND